MRIWLTIIAFLLATAPNGMSQELQIDNFRSGLDCRYADPNAQADIGWICFETETILMTGQGRCVFNGETRACNWYGYEFDYTNAQPDEEISCIVTSSEVGTIGNPDEVEAQNTKTYEYSYKLEGKDGHLYNPQYSIFSTAPAENHSIVNHTICSLNERELFQFRFEKLYPTEN